MHVKPHKFNLAYFQNGPTKDKPDHKGTQVLTHLRKSTRYSITKDPCLTAFPVPGPCLGSWHQYDDHISSVADKRISEEQQTADQRLDICETDPSPARTPS